MPFFSCFSKVCPLQTATPGSWRRYGRAIAFACAVLLLSILIYHPVRNFDYVAMDDGQYIAENTHLRDGFSLKSLRWAFATNLTEPSISAEYWEPLTLLSRIADVTVYGNNPGAFHVTSLVIHIINTFLLCVVLWQLSGAWYRSAFVALLFLIHPMNVETVCWLSARKDLLCTTFSFITLLVYGWYARKPTLARYGVLLAAFFAALMAKPMGMSLPVILLVLDVWPLSRWDVARGESGARLRLVMEKVPLFIVGVAAAIFAAIGQNEIGGLKDAAHYPFWVRVCNAPISLVTYVRRVFLPSDLTFFYPHPGMQVSITIACISTGFILCVLMLAWRCGKTQPYLLSGWLWFCLALGPVIGLIQVGDQAMADRYAYLSTIGLFIMIVWGGWDLLRHQWRIAVSVWGVYALLLCYFSMQQVWVWKSTITFYEREIQEQPTVVSYYAFLGDAYFVRQRFAEARSIYEKFAELVPDVPTAWSNLANAEVALGDDSKAIEHYTQALRIRKDWTPSIVPLAAYAIRAGREDSAVSLFERAIAIEPASEDAYRPLLNIYEKQGKWKDVMRLSQLYLQYHPGDQGMQKRLENAKSAVALGDVP